MQLLRELSLKPETAYGTVLGYDVLMQHFMGFVWKK